MTPYDALKIHIVRIHNRYRNSMLFMGLIFVISAIIIFIAGILLLGIKFAAPSLFFCLIWGGLGAIGIYRWYSLRDPSSNAAYQLIFENSDRIVMIFTPYPLNKTGLLKSIMGYSISMITDHKQVVPLIIKKRQEATEIMKLLKESFPNVYYQDNEREAYEFLKHM